MWKNKIKEGYLYQIGESPMIAITGYLGAINYGKSLEELGCSSAFIENSISITESKGIMTNTIFTKLSKITWKEKK